MNNRIKSIEVFLNEKKLCTVAKQENDIDFDLAVTLHDIKKQENNTMAYSFLDIVAYSDTTSTSYSWIKSQKLEINDKVMLKICDLQPTEPIKRVLTPEELNEAKQIYEKIKDNYPDSLNLTFRYTFVGHLITKFKHFLAKKIQANKHPQKLAIKVSINGKKICTDGDNGTIHMIINSLKDELIMYFSGVPKSKGLGFPHYVYLDKNDQVDIQLINSEFTYRWDS